MRRWSSRLSDKFVRQPKLSIPAGMLFSVLLGRQNVRGYSDENTRSGNLLWLHTDLGPSFYLAADGRVFYEDPTLGVPLREATPDERSIGLVVGARNLDSPELLNLLPPPPIGALICARCGG